MILAGDQAEYDEWNAKLIVTSTTIVASVYFSNTAALISHMPGPPFYLDSGPMGHLSCVSKSTSKRYAPPRTISGVGNLLVPAVGQENLICIKNVKITYLGVMKLFVLI
jgi:hypothetical protein